MRDWYAMLLGATFRSQAFGHYFSTSQLNPGSCAIGAMHEGREGRHENPGFDLDGVGGVEGPSFHKCPLQGQQYIPFRKRLYGKTSTITCEHEAASVVHLNDDHRLTRPAIAYLLYHEERLQKGPDPQDDALFREMFGPLEEMDGIAEAIDPKLQGVKV
jgi:hypothetical protein